jgi:cytoskeletal protein CcmA (bactofilin family)
MFRRKKPATANLDIETLIGHGTRIEGNLVVTGGVHLEGYVKGNVLTDKSGTAVLTIGPKGIVEGIVEVPRVVVHGEVRGDIKAKDKVELGASARVSGNVSYGVIEMAAGAVIQGRLVAPPSSEPVAASAAGAGKP